MTYDNTWKNFVEVKGVRRQLPPWLLSTLQTSFEDMLILASHILKTFFDELKLSYMDSILLYFGYLEC